MSVIEVLNEQDQIQIRHLEQDDLPALEWDGELRHFRRVYREVYTNVRTGKRADVGSRSSE